MTDQNEGRDSAEGGDSDEGRASEEGRERPDEAELPKAQPPWPPRGRYKVVQPVPPPKPPNPVFPYLSVSKKRRRRSDWHVLASMLIFAAIILLGCCLGGYALYFGFERP